jgi:hypothetical protein
MCSCTFATLMKRRSTSLFRYIALRYIIHVPLRVYQHACVVLYDAAAAAAAAAAVDTSCEFVHFRGCPKSNLRQPKLLTNVAFHVVQRHSCRSAHLGTEHGVKEAIVG